MRQIILTVNEKDNFYIGFAISHILIRFW
jgi:hypothetical protein